jgi:hypothetical protein
VWNNEALTRPSLVRPTTHRFPSPTTTGGGAAPMALQANIIKALAPFVRTLMAVIVRRSGYRDCR